MKAHELLSSSDKWTQGRNARNVKGRPVAATDHNANCFCITGALQRCYEDHFERQIKRNEIIKQIDAEVIHEWNDAPERTYEEVYSLLKELDI